MRGKLIGIGITALVLLACTLAGTRFEKPVSIALFAVAWSMMLVFSLLKLVAVFRHRHDERRRAQAIWGRWIDPL